MFVDSHSRSLRIALGKGSFFTREEGTNNNEYQEKNIGEFLKLKANINPELSAYEFESKSELTPSTTIGVGHTVGGKPITYNKIQSKGGMIVNQVTSKPTDGVTPEMSLAAEPVMTSNVVSGTVLIVEGVQIMVHFNIDGSQSIGEARWIPYENVVNNYFYCMPDVGDTVFVYYENQGQAVCLGSRRADDSHPDFDHPENKMMTSCNKMIKFSPDNLELVANRKQYDVDVEIPTSIRFNKEGNMVITSTETINIKAAKQILIQASGEEIDPTEAIGITKSMHDAGEEIYKADGGFQGWDSDLTYAKVVMLDMAADVGNNFVNGIKGMNPLKMIDTVKSLGNTVQSLKNTIMGPGEVAAEELPPDEPPFEDGVIQIYSLVDVRLMVGESTIAFQSDRIQIKTPVYRHLGVEKTGEYPVQSKDNTSWLDVGLDVLQFGLDILGCVPGFGIIANVANAAISLGRGDYFGALSSVVSCIPFAGPVIGNGMKIAATALKVSDKLMKVGKMLVKVVKFINMANGILADINTVLSSVDQWIGIYRDIRDGKFDWKSPGAWKRVVNSLGAVKVGFKYGVKIKQASDKKKIEAAKRRRRRQKQKQKQGNKRPKFEKKIPLMW